MSVETDLAALQERTRELERRLLRLEDEELGGSIKLVQEQLKTMAEALGSVRNINVWMLRSFVGLIFTLLAAMVIFLLTNQGGSA